MANYMNRRNPGEYRSPLSLNFPVRGSQFARILSGVRKPAKAWRRFSPFPSGRSRYE